MQNPKTTAIKMARAAGDLIFNFSKKRLKVSMKNARDIVTTADFKSESLIVSEIRKRFPDHAILSEEMGADRQKSPYRWIIDPIDGTVNYASGSEEYCVSIGLEFLGQMILGVVYQPVLKKLYVGEKGRGAYLNNRKIKVSKKTDLINALVASDNTSKQSRLQIENFEILKNISTKVRQIRILGSAVLHLCRIAEGQIDCYFKCHTNYWDFAAASIILTEAGGKLTDLRGKPISGQSESIVASNKILHPKLLKLLGSKIY